MRAGCVGFGEQHTFGAQNDRKTVITRNTKNEMRVVAMNCRNTHAMRVAAGTLLLLAGPNACSAGVGGGPAIAARAQMLVLCRRCRMAHWCKTGISYTETRQLLLQNLPALKVEVIHAVGDGSPAIAARTQKHAM